MKLEIISSEKTLFKGEVQMVTLPGSLGTFTVLENHAPLISTLTQGDIIYRAGNTEKRVTIVSGVAEVIDNRVIVCVK